MANVWQRPTLAGQHKLKNANERNWGGGERLWHIWKFSEDVTEFTSISDSKCQIYTSMKSSLRAFRISWKNYVGYWLVLCRQKDRLRMWQGNKASICQLPNWNQQWIGYLQHCYFYGHDASILYSCIMHGRINSGCAGAQYILSLHYLITIRKSKIEAPLIGKDFFCSHSLKTADLEIYTIVFIIKEILGCIVLWERIVVMNTHAKARKRVMMFLFITQRLRDIFDILVPTEVNWHLFLIYSDIALPGYNFLILTCQNKVLKPSYPLEWLQNSPLHNIK